MSDQYVKRSLMGYQGHPVHFCTIHGIELHGSKDAETHIHEVDGFPEHTPWAELFLSGKLQARPYCFKLIKFCRNQKKEREGNDKP